MDAHVIGHEPVKEALLLGLLAHEHFYMEGEPGCAKTLLAEVAANSVHLSYFFNQLHRDTRLAELIGDVMLRRESMPDGCGELIAQDVRKGGVLTAEVVLLDDISRAPGEALNVLLRMLNERKYHSMPIPLVSAIATTDPTSDAYYNEPLDPANLDRFTLQLRTRGSIGVRRWEEARRIIDRYDGPPGTREAPHRISGNSLRQAHRALAQVELPRRLVQVYRQFLDALVNKFGCTPSNSMLTDRTMLVKVPRMIKALAFLEGRTRARVEDLRVLKYILTFRVPEHVYNMLDEILKHLAEAMDNPEQDQPGDEELDGQQQGEQAAQQGQGDERDAPGEADGDLVDELMEAIGSDGSRGDEHKPMQLRARPGEEASSRYQYNPPQQVKNLDSLLGKINGRLERNSAESELHPGGSPRTWQRMRTFDEFMDTDPAETANWMESINPRLPRVFRREKKHVGGEMVIVRDVSQSMEGRYARWTSSVVTKLVELVRRKRMRIGYIEFNHVSRKYSHGGRFFTRDYDKIIEIASNVVCSGVTNYQFPMREALKEFRVRGTHNKHIVFLTDGEPTQGDWLVREERRMAKALNVAIHTLFIGTTECPEILDVISEETGGCQFLAMPDEQGGLFLAERQPRPKPEPLRRPQPAPASELKSPPGLRNWRQ
jgi:MoxR-like ATPase/Mg-chelatase subunit ChlD